MSTGPAAQQSLRAPGARDRAGTASSSGPTLRPAYAYLTLVYLVTRPCTFHSWA